MKFTRTTIPDIIIVEPPVYGDERGFLLESWHRQKFKEGGIDREFVQDNHSKSSLGILRGLHYQTEHTQGKLVRVIKGEIFDVAVDIRCSSPYFGQWVAETLSENNRKMLWMPEGFAHGFYVTSEIAEVIYKCTDYYAPEHEHSMLWNDPEIGIKWPLVNNEHPTLSDKDRHGNLLVDAEVLP